MSLEAYQAVVECHPAGGNRQEVLEAADLIHRKGYSIYDDLVHGFGGGYLPPILRTCQTAHARWSHSSSRRICASSSSPTSSHWTAGWVCSLAAAPGHIEEGLESLHSYPLEFQIAPSVKGGGNPCRALRPDG
jgi:hypothetical protein